MSDAKKDNDNGDQMGAGADIDLNESYEDDDFEIRFDKASLLAYIRDIEDDNLFKIQLLQEDEQTLEKIKS